MNLPASHSLQATTLRRLQYAQGYLTLGMVAEATAELNGIVGPDHEAPEVLDAGMHLRYVGEQWQELYDLSGRFNSLYPLRLEGWINRAFAARRLKGVEAAKAVLLEIEPIFGSEHALVPYNLACYHCLLGEIEAAKQRLEQAFSLDPAMRKVATADEDLKPLWGEIAAGPPSA